MSSNKYNCIITSLRVVYLNGHDSLWAWSYQQYYLLCHPWRRSRTWRVTKTTHTQSFGRSDHCAQIGSRLLGQVHKVWPRDAWRNEHTHQADMTQHWNARLWGLRKTHTESFGRSDHCAQIGSRLLGQVHKDWPRDAWRNKRTHRIDMAHWNAHLWGLPKTHTHITSTEPIIVEQSGSRLLG